jgi:hypothetical protein
MVISFLQMNKTDGVFYCGSIKAFGLKCDSELILYPTHVFNQRHNTNTLKSFIMVEHKRCLPLTSFNVK